MPVMVAHTVFDCGNVLPGLSTPTGSTSSEPRRDLGRGWIVVRIGIRLGLVTFFVLV